MRAIALSYRSVAAVGRSYTLAVAVGTKSAVSVDS